jgi:superfamily II DNA/RNA helicase
LPNPELWKKANLHLHEVEQEYYIVSANSWHPKWLTNAERESPEAYAFLEEKRRDWEDLSVEADPFLSLLNFKRYQSAGQREAIRSILTAPPTATIVVNLPTGSGKSLCAHLPALLRSLPPSGGVSIVVVPTTALAIDQERALQPFINYPTAYYGDSPAEERREEIRDRIRNGTQRIVFTSPESLLTSLASSVYEAADRAFLRYLVIDEAHIVEQWGDEFRPDFQQLPGFRRDLLRRTSFPTILLSATITESGLNTLENLFGQSGVFQIISAVQLRPEPSYWFAYCQDEQVKQRRLLEAVYNLPRPIIVYGSKVEDVEAWYSLLQANGFRRCDIMTGNSHLDERLRLMTNWRNGSIDLVVATSAFGLGVDLPDVRTIIHVCIPETIDRFYQEVGRAGRDGKATVSLTLYSRQDYDTAASINDITYITPELGQKRWETMFLAKHALGGNRYRVPIDIAPLYNPDLFSRRNNLWNIRTLTLMSRSGLIEIDAESPPKKKGDGSDESFEEVKKLHQNTRIIHILDQQHLDVAKWQEVVEPVRVKRQKSNYRNLELMKEALHQPAKRCIADIIYEAYSIPTRASPYRSQVYVSKACGGCSYCRGQESEPYAGITPVPRVVWKESHFVIGQGLQSKLKEVCKSLLLIFYNPMNHKSWEQDLNQLIRWFIRQGICNIVVQRSLHNAFITQARQAGQEEIFMFEELELRMPQVPTLIYWQESIIPQNYIDLPMSGIPRIVMLPEDTLEPGSTYRKLIDVFSGCKYKFNLFCTEVGL